MPEDPARRNGSDWGPLAGVGMVVLMVGCCAGVPLIAALAGSVAATTLLGVGGGLIVAVALFAAVALRVRARRRACEPHDQHAPPTPADSPYASSHKRSETDPQDRAPLLKQRSG